MNKTVDFQTAKELRDAGFPWAGWECNPTALEIIEQMPSITTISKSDLGDWICSFRLPGFQYDFRHDECPHKAAAMAYIAWKKGGEL